MFPFKMLELPVADSMFPCTGASHVKSNAYQPLGVCHCLTELLGFMAIKYAEDVEVAIANMTENCPWERDILEIFLRQRYAVRKTRDGNTDVGGQDLPVWNQSQRCVICIVPRLPKNIPFGLTLFPFKAKTLMFFGNRLHCQGLIRDIAIIHTVEFKEEGWEQRERRSGEPIDSVNLLVVKKLDSRYSNP